MKDPENKEREADANFLQSLISEAKNDSDARENLDSIKDLLPQLIQCNKDLNETLRETCRTNTILKEQLKWCNKMNDQLKDRYDEQSRKIDSINSHIDKVIEEAPRKLNLTVKVSEADLAAIQKENNRTIQIINQRLSLHMKEVWSTMKKLSSENGLYLSGPMYWVGCFFFWFGVIMFLFSIFFWIYPLIH